MFGAWSSEDRLPRTWWWGERGLVGALFHDLGARESLGRWSEFLNLIKFAGPGHSWGVLKYAHVVVEPSFGSQGFGRPDAVALLEFDIKGHVVIFFEAKRGLYAETAKLPLGRAAPGFNSTLNGQLELNHRLALALAHTNSPSVLQEDEWIMETPYGVTKVRKVKDRDVLDGLLAPLRGHPRASYLHVILTLDSNNPFEDSTNAPYMPEIFLSDSEANRWETEKDRFGWVGWYKIIALANTWLERGESSMFLDTWAFTGQKKLPREDPAVSGQTAPATPGWAAIRPSRGVSLIFAPQINSRTYLHFSWRGEGSALRDYSHSEIDLPGADRSRRTHQVLPLIGDELPTTRPRPEYTDVRIWNRRVIDANSNCARILQANDTA